MEHDKTAARGQVGVLALLSDFGLADAYVGVMKAVILTYNPAIPIIDLTHHIPPFDIVAASYVLFSAWRYVPYTSVLVSVVDPGVGSSRREVIVTDGHRTLVAPDNGTSSLLVRFSRTGRVPPVHAYRADWETLQALAAQRDPTSHTFDGRDLFAPLGARILTDGIESVRGEAVEPVYLNEVETHVTPGPLLHGSVLHVDHFGNCVTSVHREDAVSAGVDPDELSDWRVTASSHTSLMLHGISSHFADVKRATALAYWGSSGFLEIAVREGNAAEQFGIARGTPVTLQQ